MNIRSEDVAFADRVASGEWNATPGSDSFSVEAGQVVVLGDEDDRWRGWFRCTLPDGPSAWVHESFFKPENAGNARFLENYTAREMSIHIGDPVTVLREVGGWSWVRRESGAEGWVPDEVLRVPPARCRPY